MVKTQLGYYSLYLEDLNLTFLLSSGFGYMALYLWQTTSFCEMPNVKRHGTKHIQTENGKLEANKLQRVQS